jgi:hypothetical protein
MTINWINHKTFGEYPPESLKVFLLCRDNSHQDNPCLIFTGYYTEYDGNGFRFYCPMKKKKSKNEISYQYFKVCDSGWEVVAWATMPCPYTEAKAIDR